MNLFDLIHGSFRTAAPLLPPPPIENGKCKVCGTWATQSAHPHFFYCSSCRCYSNYLPNDIYEDTSWYENISAEVIERDLGHWRRVAKRASSFLEAGTFSHIIDLAGGIGLFSAAFQEIIPVPVVLVDRCTIRPSTTRYHAQIQNQIIKSDLSTFLSGQPNNTYIRPLLLNSHFIEHLELGELVNFFHLLKVGFPSALCCIYFPNAGRARGNERNFLHFNTNLPGEHRIIWSLKSFLALMRATQIHVIHAEPFDLDILAICRL
jgi:hypothetical protein